MLPGLLPSWHSTRSRCGNRLSFPSLDAYFGSIHPGPHPTSMFRAVIHSYQHTPRWLSCGWWHCCKAWYRTNDLGGRWNHFRGRGCTLSRWGSDLWGHWVVAATRCLHEHSTMRPAALDKGRGGYQLTTTIWALRWFGLSYLGCSLASNVAEFEVELAHRRPSAKI